MLPPLLSPFSLLLLILMLISPHIDTTPYYAIIVITLIDTFADEPDIEMPLMPPLLTPSSPMAIEPPLMIRRHDDATAADAISRLPRRLRCRWLIR
jgi:hypothetical protein